MQGSHLETVLEFTPGDIMLFDACLIPSCVKRSKPITTNG